MKVWTAKYKEVLCASINGQGAIENTNRVQPEQLERKVLQDTPEGKTV